VKSTGNDLGTLEALKQMTGGTGKLLQAELEKSESSIWSVIPNKLVDHQAILLLRMLIFLAENCLILRAYR